MGAKAKPPTTRRSKSPGAKRSAKVSERKQHRFYPDSVPPAMAHEVFDTSRVEEDGTELLDEGEAIMESPGSIPPSPRRSSRAPHPPRPSVRPPALKPEEVRLDTPLSYASNPAAVLLDAPMSLPPTVASPRAERTRGFPLLIAVFAFVIVGMLVLVVRAASRRDASGQGAATTAASNTAFAPTPTDPTRFSPERARENVEAIVTNARSCRATNDGPTSLGVRVAFAQTGRVVGVEIAGPLAGSAAGDCFQAALREARIPPFRGQTALFERTLALP